jgi:iron complex outermembrane receptor protein
MQFFRSTSSTLMLAAALVSTTAYAQTAPSKSATPPKANDAPSTGEIVVTAQRRTESLQKVNIAATVVSGEALQEKAVVRQLDIQNIAPGLSITKAGLTESVNIRGIGLASGSPNVANGVANYLDGIYQPPIVSGGNFYDIQSVEVLRGPQGTLVGASSTGGALIINTNRPQLGKLGGHYSVEYGSYNHVQGDAAVNLPIGNTLAVRVAGVETSRDSYYTDTGTFANQPDRLNEKDGRASILWKPGRFSAYFKVEAVDRQTGGFAWAPIAGTAYNPIVQATGQTIFPQNAPYVLSYNAPTSAYERANIYTAELKYEFPGGLVVRSLTGHMNKRINYLYDNDGTALAGATIPAIDRPTTPFNEPAVVNGNVTQTQFVREREYSEEVDIISPAAKPFNYILGGYFQRNKIDVSIQNYAGGSPIGQAQIDTTNNKVVIGFFGQANYRLNHMFELQLGARYNGFTINDAGAVKIPGPNLNIGQTGRETDHAISGKAAINFTPNDNTLIYAFAARGYKPGGANPGVAPGNPTTFLPETVWDYEFGWKQSFLNRHIQTQIGAYYNDYQNFQQSALNTVTGTNNVLFNVASAKIKGVEAQVQARVSGFRFDAGLAYTDSQLSPLSIVNNRLLPSTAKGAQCAAGQTTGCFDYTPYIQTTSNGPALFAPGWTWNAALAYDYKLGSKTTLTPRIQYSYVGSQWGNLFYSPLSDLINAHHLVSATVTLAFDKFKLEGYGNNLTKEYYVAGQSGNNAFFGAPREFGIRFSGKF